MKKIILVSLLMLVVQKKVVAQGYTIIYEKEVNQDGNNQLDKITDPAIRKQVEAQLRKVSMFELLHKENVSTFSKQEIDENKSDNSMSLQDEQSSNIKVIDMTGEGKSAILYKDLSNKSYLKSTYLLGKAFLVKDMLPTYNWELLNETKTIGNYVCKKATTTYNSKEVIAWYASSIPLSDGPDEYYGLPGLIVELTDGGTSYNALSVKETSDISITKPSKGKKVTKAKYKQIVEDKTDALKQQYKN